MSLEVFNSDGFFDQAYTYHADHLGSIRFVTDSVGEIVNATERFERKLTRREIGMIESNYSYDAQSNLLAANDQALTGSNARRVYRQCS